VAGVLHTGMRSSSSRKVNVIVTNENSGIGALGIRGRSRGIIQLCILC